MIKKVTISSSKDIPKVRARVGELLQDSGVVVELNVTRGPISFPYKVTKDIGIFRGIFPTFRKLKGKERIYFDFDKRFATVLDSMLTVSFPFELLGYDEEGEGVRVFDFDRKVFIDAPVPLVTLEYTHSLVTMLDKFEFIGEVHLNELFSHVSLFKRFAPKAFLGRKAFVSIKRPSGTFYYKANSFVYFARTFLFAKKKWALGYIDYTKKVILIEKTEDPRKAFAIIPFFSDSLPFRIYLDITQDFSIPS